jgi:hypothetical protein
VALGEPEGRIRAVGRNFTPRSLRPPVQDLPVSSRQEVMGREQEIAEFAEKRTLFSFTGCRSNSHGEKNSKDTEFVSSSDAVLRLTIGSRCS